MKRIAIAAALLAAGTLAALPAQAHSSRGGSRTSLSVQWGVPVAGGFYYGPPYYGPGYYRPWGAHPYYRPWYGPSVLVPPAYVYGPPAVITVPSQPPIYIEQDRAVPGPQAASGYWYWCAESRSYYPYVSECVGAWQPVPAQPAR